MLNFWIKSRKRFESDCQIQRNLNLRSRIRRNELDSEMNQKPQESLKNQPASSGSSKSFFRSSAIWLRDLSLKQLENMISILGVFLMNVHRSLTVRLVFGYNRQESLQ